MIGAAATTIEVAIVGVGPHGLGIFERLVANATDILGKRELRIHLIDPFDDGGGRIWRIEQPAELLMNSLPEDVTMYLDESVQCSGPIRTGPSLLEWARAQSEGRGGVFESGHPVSEGDFVSRRVQAAYLDAFRSEILDELPESISVETHDMKATSLTESAIGKQYLTLESGSTLEVDAVVLAIGHVEVNPSEAEEQLRTVAERLGLAYVPPQNTADLDLSFIGSNDDVIVRGMGLAFVDLVALLFEGRGGKFNEVDGELVYEPYGGEPRLFVGSRRGVPHRAKSSQRLLADPAPLPKFFAPKALARLIRDYPQVSMQDHVRPLIAKEVAWSYYHELFNAHRDRVGCSWAEFSERFIPASLAEIDALVAEFVAPEDVFDLRLRDQPLEDCAFTSSEELQQFVRQHLSRDIVRRTEPAFSAEAGAVRAYLSIFNIMGFLWHSERLDPRSHTDGLAWWRGLHNYSVVGPPVERARQLHALSRAGFVRFLGPDVRVEVDEDAGVFCATGRLCPSAATARILVDARLAEPSLDNVSDAMLRGLVERGDISDEFVCDGGKRISTGLVKVTTTDSRVVNAQGQPHSNRFALGIFTTLRTGAAFHPPRTGSAGFRRADLIARTALRAATEIG